MPGCLLPEVNGNLQTERISIPIEWTQHTSHRVYVCVSHTAIIEHPIIGTFFVLSLTERGILSSTLLVDCSQCFAGND